MTSGMVKSVDPPQQQMMLTTENQPPRGYEGRGSHRLTGPPFHHATHHHLLPFTYVISDTISVVLVEQSVQRVGLDQYRLVSVLTDTHSSFVADTTPSLKKRPTYDLL